MSVDLQKNADRFTGFADIYDKVRPRYPQKAVDILLNYLGKTPQTVVDLGSGTGISAVSWIPHSGKVIGIEPSADMLDIARQNAKQHPNITFANAYAHDTGLAGESADMVICSQSFHWMEPCETLKEVNRILKPGGIFAVTDCDWPPVFKWQAEKAFCRLFCKVSEIEKTDPRFMNSVLRWDKKRHLERIRNSGFFYFAREIVFSSTEEFDADRYIGLAVSQGGLNAILRVDASLVEPEFDEFKHTVYSLFKEKTLPVMICYRMQIGIKHM